MFEAILPFAICCTSPLLPPPSLAAGGQEAGQAEAERAPGAAPQQRPPAVGVGEHLIEPSLDLCPVSAVTHFLYLLIKPAGPA